MALSKHTTFEDRCLRATECPRVVDTGEWSLSTTRGRAVQLGGLIDGNLNQYQEHFNKNHHIYEWGWAMVFNTTFNNISVIS